MFQVGFPPELTKLREKWGRGDGGKQRQAVFDQLLAGLQQVSLEAVPWGKIRPLESLERPKFPTRALPKTLRNWVEAEAHATQTPTDLAGMLALAVCSATLARRVEVQARPGWREPVNIYTSVLLEPGNRKSAVFNDALKPLRELESEQIAAAREDVARRQSQRRTQLARLRMLERAAALSDSDGDRQQAEDLAARLAGERPAALPRLLVDDATSEKLGMLLAEQGGRIASMSPEGGVFEQMATQYSRGLPQLNVYLMGHSGDDLATDRVTRETLRIERPALTCAYAMQPAVIKGLAATPAFRGRGLLARFLYAVPQSRIGQREVAPTPVADEIRAAYRDTVRRLAAVPAGQVLELTDEAGRLLRAWERELEAMLDDGGPLDLLRDWGAKLAGATLRIAAVLHMVEQVEEQGEQEVEQERAGSGAIEPISARALAAAIEVARYLIPHAEAALNLMEGKDDTSDADARYVLRWIERHGRREFTKTELSHHGKRRFPQVELLEPVLSNLAWRGYLRQRPAAEGKVGRPASPVYVVNPAVFGDGEEVASEEEESGDRGQETVGQVACGNIGSAVEQVEKVTRREWPVVRGAEAGGSDQKSASVLAFPISPFVDDEGSTGQDAAT